MYQRSYSDAQLTAAVAAAHSWRGVLRAVGLKGTSAGSRRSVQRRATTLGLSTDHFTGQRTWSDADLRSALVDVDSWSQVATTLGLAPSGGTLTSLRAHAVRLGVDTARLESQPPMPSEKVISNEYRPGSLRDAGSLYAATWFALRGAKISWPLEPCRYDLLVDVDKALSRVQVKTTVTEGRAATVSLSNSRRFGHAIYGPDEVDAFFVIDGALTAYLIPYPDVAGYQQLALGRYRNYVVADGGRLIPPISCASRAP